MHPRLFSPHLRLVSPTEPPAAVALEAVPPASRRPSLGRVLVVDPEPLLDDTLRYCLRQAGATHVLFARDGNSGLEAAILRKPDLVLTEVLLPGRDGFSLAAALRDRLDVLAPVIFLTAAVGFAFRDRAPADVGALGVIGKPFPIAAFPALVHGLLEADQQRRVRQA